MSARKGTANLVNRRAGRWLKYWRIVRMMSQGQLAELSGLSRTSISSYERGAGNIRSEHLVTLARALGLQSLDQLMPLDEREPPWYRPEKVSGN